MQGKSFRCGRMADFSHASAGDHAIETFSFMTQDEITFIETAFRFLLWSTQRRIGHLSPYATMDHCGFIMAHGRELRVYRRLLT
jgi:hypothetical protein